MNWKRSFLWKIDDALWWNILLVLHMPSQQLKVKSSLLHLKGVEAFICGPNGSALNNSNHFLNNINHIVTPIVTTAAHGPSFRRLL